jgi:hypothetical protein
MGQPGELRPIRDFAKDLRDSHHNSLLPFWEKVYRRCFRQFASMTLLPADGLAQRAGIDRVVTLTTGKHIFIDEKFRTENWGDVLLEIFSDKERRTPGWVTKDLWSDYIAYAIMPRCHCILLPVIQLQGAWKKHEHDWRARYKTKDSQNSGYVTHNIAIPHDILGAAIDEEFHAHWGKDDG